MPLDLPTRLDLFAIGRDYVLNNAKRIDPAQVDVEGSDVNLFTGSMSELAYYLVLQMAQEIANLGLDGAEGDDLDRLAWDRYKLLRKGATNAEVPLTLARPTNAGGAGTIPEGTKIISLTGIPYVLQNDATFTATSLAPSSPVQAVSQLAGAGQQVGKNTLNRWDNVNNNFDTTIAVNNDEPAAGAADRETNDVFKERIRDFFVSARRGTLGAIEFGARTVAGVESADAVEAIDTDGSAARFVTLFVADGSGTSNRVLAQKVRDILPEWKAGGIFVAVSSSTPQIVDLEFKLTFRAGRDTTDLRTNIRASIVGFVNSLGVNEVLRVADLFTVLRRFRDSGLVVTDDSIIIPQNDIVPETGRTIRTRTQNVVLV